jgi:hypothetical protein
MQKHKGGHRTGSGTYWNLETGEKLVIEREGVLPGNEGTSYLRVPSAIMLPFGHVLGVLYVLALPIVPIVMMAAIMTSKFTASAFSLSVRSLSFGWRPMASYLTGNKKFKGPGKDKM